MTETRRVGVLPPFFGEEIRISLSAASTALIAPSFFSFGKPLYNTKSKKKPKKTPTLLSPTPLSCEM